MQFVQEAVDIAAQFIGSLSDAFHFSEEGFEFFVAHHGFKQVAVENAQGRGLFASVLASGAEWMDVFTCSGGHGFPGVCVGHRVVRGDT